MKPVNKKYLFVILLIATTWFQCIGQDSVEVRIKEIKTECEKINKEIKKFKLVQSDVNDLSAEGGILKKYLDVNTLRKAALTLFGETGQSTTEYYFLNGNLVLVNEQVEMYKTPLGMGKVETESVETNKLYFNNQKLMRWMNNDDETVDHLLYSEKEKEILDDLKNIVIKSK
jgi:hypothetical protein